MKTKHIWVSLLGLAAVSGAVAGVAPARADVCQDVDIKVKNHKSVKIKALKIEYKFQYDNTTRTESFPNKEVPAGATTLVASDQDLKGGEGNKLLSMKLHFQAWCGGKWSKTFVSAEDTTFDNDAPCSRGRTYRIDLPPTDVCTLP